MTYFKNCKTIEELKHEYRRLAKENHPDAGGYAEVMKAINAEYDRLFNTLQREHNASANEDKQNNESPEAWRELIEKLMRLDGVVIEICGSWIWLSGNTYPHKAAIKELGFKWANAKKMWYMGEMKRKTRKSTDMDEIRAKYGSQIFQSNAQRVLRLA